jgi:hypothetical protein
MLQIILSMIVQLLLGALKEVYLDVTIVGKNVMKFDSFVSENTSVTCVSLTLTAFVDKL